MSFLLEPNFMASIFFQHLTCENPHVQNHVLPPRRGHILQDIAENRMSLYLNYHKKHGMKLSVKFIITSSINI